MKTRFVITYLLNLFDLLCTLHWVNLYGIGIEANPIGRWLISTNLAIPVKTIGIGACFIALYAGVKRYPRWNWTGWLVLGVYGVLAVYHLFIALTVLRGGVF